MPYALSAATAQAWATGRAIDLWVAFGPDLAGVPGTHAGLVAEFARVRADGALLGLVDGTGRADVRVSADPPPAPFGVFAAMRAAGIDDVRRVGVVGVGAEALRAGRRAGAGAVVGLASDDPELRRPLLLAEPDRIVSITGFAEMDAAHYGTGRRSREYVLLNPGPAVVSDRVHQAVAGPDLCHREPEYSALFARVKAKLLGVAGVPADWAVCLIGGSGTAAMEAMTGCMVRRGRCILVCRNGTYGERLAVIAERLGIDVVSVEAPDTEPIDPARVAAVLDAEPGVDAVALVAHETTTGLLNPVHEIAAAARARGVPAIVDAISAFGSEEIHVPGSGIEVLAGTSNKNLHGLPGVSFLLLSPAAQARAAEVAPRSLYFDIPNYLRAQARDSVPFTPPVPAVYGLEAALDELADEGLDHRIAQYRARTALLDGAFERLGLIPAVAPAHRSGSVRSLPLPPGIAYEALHDALKREGYVIYAGLGAAAASSFRVCTLGALELDALAGFADALERALVVLGYPAPAAARA